MDAPEHDSVNSNSAHQRLASIVKGDLGIPFSHLARFATPVYDLYGIDPATDEVLEAAQPDEAEEHVAVLETARLFWNLFASDTCRDVYARLESLLLGGNPDAEEEAVFAALFARMRQRWDSLPAAVRETFSPSGDAGETLPTEEMPADADCPSYLPSASPEQLAEFARPLLESDEIRDAPELVSDLMGRAQDYWQLATLEEEEFNQFLEKLVERYGETDEERELIRAEAHMMVARFYRLFAE